MSWITLILGGSSGPLVQHLCKITQKKLLDQLTHQGVDGFYTKGVVEERRQKHSEDGNNLTTC